MEPMIKWLGGATAAILLLIGAGSLAGGFLSSEEAEAQTDASLALVEISEEALAEGQGETVTEAIPAEPAAVEPDIQRAAAGDPFVIKRILPIDGPIKYGEWHWDESGVPDGPIVATVDLEARVISVFKGGYEIGAAAAMLGTKEHPTPLGTFPILWKQRHNVSEKYNNAPMPFSMFLTGDGVAIHGGAQVENGYASHGCISVPTEFAEKMFAVASKGDKVIITRGQTIGMGDSIL
jgi:lipoprotein-anchoring transpeptidase ErfK/SrfK